MRAISSPRPRCNSKSAFQRSLSNGNLCHARLSRTDSAYNLNYTHASSAEDASKYRKSSSCSKMGKDVRLKVVGPTLGALVMLSQLAVGGPGSAMAREDPEKHSMQTQLHRRADNAASQNTSYTDAQERDCNEHMSFKSAPLSTNPLSATPYACSRAPDFPESRSRMTLAERALAATAQRQ